MRAWCLKNPGRAIYGVGLLIHVIAGLIVYFYHVILRSGFPPNSSPSTLSVGRYYLYGALFLGAYFRRRCISRLVVPYLKNPSVENAERLETFPFKQAVLSGFCWFSAIPIIGLAAVLLNGRVHPIFFPHFCLSILFAGLIAMAHSSAFYVYLMTELLKEKHMPITPRLRSWASLTPWIAIVVPFLTAVVFLSFDRPLQMHHESYLKLGRFFTFLLAFSSYAWVLCARLSSHVIRRNAFSLTASTKE